MNPEVAVVGQAPKNKIKSEKRKADISPVFVELQATHRR
jgi:hypothetical protein